MNLDEVIARIEISTLMSLYNTAGDSGLRGQGLHRRWPVRRRGESAIRTPPPQHVNNNDDGVRYSERKNVFPGHDRNWT